MRDTQMKTKTEEIAQLEMVGYLARQNIVLNRIGAIGTSLILDCSVAKPRWYFRSSYFNRYLPGNYFSPEDIGIISRCKKIRKLAVREGFEPSMPFDIHTFQACSFDRSDTSPGDSLCHARIYVDDRLASQAQGRVEKQNAGLLKPYPAGRVNVA